MRQPGGRSHESQRVRQVPPRHHRLVLADPYEAEKISGNLLRVKKLKVEEALRKYGHDTHHAEIQKDGA